MIVRDVKKIVSNAEWEVRTNLAAAYRAIYYLGYEESMFGHLSARVPGEDDVMLLNPFGLTFDEITASSLVKVNKDKKILIDNGFSLNEAAWNIHSGLMFNRYDINTIIHLHTADGVAVSAQKTGFLPLSQDGVLFYNDIAYHDYEGIVVNPEEAPRMLADLKQKKILVLRNHGSLFVGASIAEAFFTMYNYEKACTQQVKALTAGGVKEVLQISKHILNDVPQERDVVLDSLPKRIVNSHEETSYQVVYDGWIRRMKRLYPDFDS